MYILVQLGLLKEGYENTYSSAANICPVSIEAGPAEAERRDDRSIRKIRIRGKESQWIPIDQSATKLTKRQSASGYPRSHYAERLSAETSTATDQGKVATCSAPKI
jgi:hypothetical protein